MFQLFDKVWETSKTSDPADKERNKKQVGKKELGKEGNTYANT